MHASYSNFSYSRQLHKKIRYQQGSLNKTCVQAINNSTFTGLRTTPTVGINPAIEG